jgi:hypothetical protein
LKKKKFKTNDKITIGAIFCHVINNKALFQFNPSKTFGNQKWNGAIPLFTINENANNIVIIKFLFLVHSKKHEKKIIKNNKILDAIAWIRKYFKHASEENKLSNFIERGIKDNKLISKPIHTLNHEDEQIEIRVPKTNVKKNKSLKEFFIIKKKRNFTFILRVWT